MKYNKQLHAGSLHRNLKEFGYSTLTLEYVEDQLEQVLNGTTPKNIIGMMAESFVKEHGVTKE